MAFFIKVAGKKNMYQQLLVVYMTRKNSWSESKPSMSVGASIFWKVSQVGKVQEKNGTEGPPGQYAVSIFDSIQKIREK